MQHITRKQYINVRWYLYSIQFHGCINMIDIPLHCVTRPTCVTLRQSHFLLSLPNHLVLAFKPSSKGLLWDKLSHYAKRTLYFDNRDWTCITYSTFDSLTEYRLGNKEPQWAFKFIWLHNGEVYALWCDIKFSHLSPN